MLKTAFLTLAAVATLAATGASAQPAPRGDAALLSHPVGRNVCTGAQAGSLRGRINRDLNAHIIDGGSARHWNQQIGALTNSARVACGRRDWRLITEVYGNYNGILHQLEQAEARPHRR